MHRSFRDDHPGLLLDLYAPDAAYIAWRAGKTGVSTFDLFARRAPFGGAYLLTAGLEAGAEYLQSLRYTDEELTFLGQIRDYDPAFLDVLSRLRFTGDVHAIPEGTVSFPHEPLVRVTAPFCEGILVESALLQAVNLATLIATKAARVVTAAAGRRVAEFALRRAQEPYTVARASAIGGTSSTSFLGAALRFRLPATGSMPHALVQLFDDEESAFRAVAESFNRYTLLLDTYDASKAITTAITVAKEAQRDLGHTLTAIRIDSGDLLAQSRTIRAALDAAGLPTVRILVSGDMDEFSVAQLVAAGAPIDAFGVGTSLGVGAGSLEHQVAGGSLGGVYKLAWTEGPDGGEPRVKISGEKSTWPGKKQVYRVGAFERDWIGLAEEVPPPGAAPLLRPVIRGGRIMAGSLPPLSEISEHAQAQLRLLPEKHARLIGAEAYPVAWSDGLVAMRNAVRAAHGAGA